MDTRSIHQERRDGGMDPNLSLNDAGTRIERIDTVHVTDQFQWYVDNKKLIQKLCRRMMKRHDCGSHISFDDLMAHCLDKLPKILERDLIGTEGANSRHHTKTTSGWVWMSLHYVCRNYIKRQNYRAKL